MQGENQNVLIGLCIGYRVIFFTMLVHGIRNKRVH